MSNFARTGLRPDRCTHCGGEVVWGTLQNGQHRPFNRQPVRPADVAPSARFAYSRRAGAVVNLDGERHPPELVLIEHACREYAEWRERQRLAKLHAFSADSIRDALTPEDR